MYTYPAGVERIIDGDTVKLDVSLGFDTWHRGTFRLLGCNARELAQPGGKEAALHLTSMLPPGTPVTIQSVKPDKFGERYLATVTLPDGSDLVAGLIASDWAAAWNGAGAKPVPPWPRP